MPSLKKNVVFNYFGQAYVAFVGILVLPLYLRFLGPEAFGLIGFFTLLQSWMQLLDMGLSPALSREIARVRGGEARGHLKTLLCSLEVIFLGIAVATGAAVFAAREWVALEWLAVQSLELQLVSTCIGLMGVMLAIRCFSSLYRGGIEGFEQQVWLNQYNILFNTLRFPGALAVIWLLGQDLLVFFIYQLLIAVVEALVIKAKLHKFVSAAGAGIARFSILEIKRILPFAVGLAYTGGIWVLVSQLDKLLLSKYLSLQDYGYFSLVATISSGVLLLSVPVSRAIMPRMTLLLSQGKNSEMLELYRVATRLVVCIVAPVTLVLALFPSEIIVLWTGNADAADWVEPVLPLFVLGNGLLAVGAFQYYLQFAHGKIGLHVKYNTVSAAISVPLIIYAAANHGVIGVGYVWLGFRVLSLLIWTPYVHKVFAPGVHLKWLFFDVLPAVLVAAIGAALPYYLAKKIAAESSFLELILIVGTLIFSFGMAFLMTFRERLKGLIRERV